MFLIKNGNDKNGAIEVEVTPITVEECKSLQNEVATPVMITQEECMFLKYNLDLLLRLYKAKRREKRILRENDFEDLFFDLELFSDYVAGAANFVVSGKRFRIFQLKHLCKFAHFPHMMRFLANEEMLKKAPKNHIYATINILTYYFLIHLAERNDTVDRRAIIYKTAVP